MSKKFTMTLLSSSLAGLLVMSGGVSAQNGTYSVLQDDSQTSSGEAKYGSTYEVVKTGDNGNFRYEVKEKKEKNGKKRSLFKFDSEGNVTVKGKGITHTLHDPALKDFARTAEGKKNEQNGNTPPHKLTDSAVRGVYNKVYGLEKTEITGFSVEDGENGKVSLGSDAKVSGEFSVAVGNGARATEKASTSVGSWSAALGQQSVALGVGAYAYANASTAAGTAAYVDGSAIYGTAIGNYAKVDKNATEGTALGAKATVTNKNSVALGAKATVTNKNSVALGANSRTTRDNEVYIGYEAEPGKAYKTRVLGGLSDGTRPSDAATVRQVDRVKDSVEQLAQDTNTRLVVEAKKSREYTDSRTTVGVNSDGTLTRAEGASKTLAVNDGLVALSGRTDRIDAAVGSVDRRVTKNTQAIQSNTRQLQEHNARLNSQQRQIRENHEEMKRAAAQ
ncbi:hypothetical protein, partial [Escherichia coli]|uniref:hypothetical protein n=1 Tax=Escherichia coli TaxID=562 RepID=UPI0010CCAA4C